MFQNTFPNAVMESLKYSKYATLTITHNANKKKRKKIRS